MTRKNRCSRSFAVTLLSAAAFMLCGGCTPIGSGELETFLRDMLLNAAAAFLL